MFFLTWSGWRSPRSKNEDADHVTSGFCYRSLCLEVYWYHSKVLNRLSNCQTFKPLSSLNWHQTYIIVLRRASDHDDSTFQNAACPLLHPPLSGQHNRALVVSNVSQARALSPPDFFNKLKSESSICLIMWKLQRLEMIAQKIAFVRIINASQVQKPCSYQETLTVLMRGFSGG